MNLDIFETKFIPISIHNWIYLLNPISRDKDVTKSLFSWDKVAFSRPETDYVSSRLPNPYNLPKRLSLDATSSNPIAGRSLKSHKIQSTSYPQSPTRVKWIYGYHSSRVVQNASYLAPSYNQLCFNGLGLED